MGGCDGVSGERSGGLDQGSGFGKERRWCTGEMLRKGEKNHGCLPGPGSECLVDGDREPWMGIKGSVSPSHHAGRN